MRSLRDVTDGVRSDDYEDAHPNSRSTARHRANNLQSSSGRNASGISIPQPRSLQQALSKMPLTPIGSFQQNLLLQPQETSEKLLSMPDFLSMQELQQKVDSTSELLPHPEVNRSRKYRQLSKTSHKTSVQKLLSPKKSAIESQPDEATRKMAPLLERAIVSIMQSAEERRLLHCDTPESSPTITSFNSPLSECPPSVSVSVSHVPLMRTESVHDLIQVLISEIDYGGYANTVFIAAMAYLARIPTSCVCGVGHVACGFHTSTICTCAFCSITKMNWYRFTLLAIMIATKVHAEKGSSRHVNRKFADVSGVPLSEIRVLELEFLFLIDFTLMITQEEYEQWAAWMHQLAKSSKSGDTGTPIVRWFNDHEDRQPNVVSPVDFDASLSDFEPQQRLFPYFMETMMM